ncbi:LAMI_0E08438g1_1 [Lachancea mirantina]|uniref:LAMI_0E08438g1_1 n=1 Tax=Lachancea mirantina TaxID=1230905 RepID=A0A1G4JN46_9SACH|nr:LAMI_0E08438g1_1 [Lachancea mirantina]
MISALTRRLLRDWKRLNHQYEPAYHVKPFDADLHIWNFVLTGKDGEIDAEVFGMIYIGGDELNPVIVMRCSTPNETFPLNRNVSLTHLGSVVLISGLTGLLEHVKQRVWSRMNLSTEPGVFDWRLTRAWNRVMVKDFKQVFPDLASEFPVSETETLLVQQWSDCNARREPRPAPKFKFQNFTPATTLACDSNDNQHMKRQRTGAEEHKGMERLWNLDDCEPELQRKKRQG